MRLKCIRLAGFKSFVDPAEVHIESGLTGIVGGDKRQTACGRAAGAQALQVFDTWAGVLPPDAFQRWCVAPMQRIVAGVRKTVPNARIIGFPRGAGSNLSRYIEQVPVSAVGLDWMIDPAFARDTIQRRVPVQGNLDPLVLRAGGEALDRGVDAVLSTFAGGPFIFNLGHGILPDTPIAHVERMIARVRK